MKRPFYLNAALAFAFVVSVLFACQKEDEVSANDASESSATTTLIDSTGVKPDSVCHGKGHHPPFPADSVKHDSTGHHHDHHKNKHNH